MVPAVSSRYTVTCFFWPILHARSRAYSRDSTVRENSAVMPKLRMIMTLIHMTTRTIKANTQSGGKDEMRHLEVFKPELNTAHRGLTARLQSAAGKGRRQPHHSPTCPSGADHHSSLPQLRTPNVLFSTMETRPACRCSGSSLGRR